MSAGLFKFFKKEIPVANTVAQEKFTDNDQTLLFIEDIAAPEDVLDALGAVVMTTVEPSGRSSVIAVLPNCRDRGCERVVAINGHGVPYARIGGLALDARFERDAGQIAAMVGGQWVLDWLSDRHAEANSGFDRSTLHP